MNVHALLRSARNGEYAASWGATDEEREARYPCDDVVAEPDQEMWRAVAVDAPSALVWRWVCQVRVAPYSYDWIDNRGKQSPRELIDGLDQVEVGQRAIIFDIVDVEPGRSLTMVTDHRLFGKVAVTYLVEPVGDERSRIVAKLAVVYPPGIVGFIGRPTLPLGDLVMMRKQLLTLKSLAERDAGR